MDLKVIRSRRRTIAIRVTRDGVEVRAPLFVSKAKITDFVRRHEGWIEKQKAKLSAFDEDARKYPPLDEADIERLKNEAKRVIPARADYFAKKIGVEYNRITVRCQKTRWGSASTKGNLNFNCLLMLTPGEVIDSVVVHELCHLKHMDHSKEFYNEVTSVYPEYRKWNGWLRNNGRLILSRIK
ncbi:MAG: M48 family metallopeptidase [Clostridia bacterium]|nr:M48 family metallopeptidase [Clostridia bacterium]